MFRGQVSIARIFLSMIIVASFIIGSIPNQIVYESGMETNKSVITEQETSMFGSRSESYDLGIDGIGIQADSDYWTGNCYPMTDNCIVVESLIPKDIAVTVTNYGAESVDEVVINLMIKSTADGLVQYDNTFSSDAFLNYPSHPMNISDSLETGDSVVFLFNRENDRLQRIFDDRDENHARFPMFLISGPSYIQAKIIVEDDDANNNRFREDVEVAKWIENGEHPDDEVGPSIWFGDTDDNGADSLYYINMHRATDFDHDADGCGWARDCTDGDGTDNIPAALNGNYAIATFNSEGWYKEGANSEECNWDEFGDNDCPKFTSQPYQDDYFVSPLMDLSGMEEMSLSFTYRGNLEEGDIFNVQASKDDWNQDWKNIGYLSSDNTSMEWTEFELDSEKFEGYFGHDDTDGIYLRFQAYSDGDDTTECNGSPCSVFFIDNIIVRGSEKITHDVAIGDITVDKSFNVADAPPNSLWREVNATIINVGESSWTELPVKISITNLQGQDVSGYLDESLFYLYDLDGESTYGDITADFTQNKIFAAFQTPQANVYYVTVEVLVAAGKDLIPDNNTMTVEFRVFDSFFFDDGGSDRDIYSYTKAERKSNSQNSWIVREMANGAYSGNYVWQYAKESGYSQDDPTTGGDSDDSLITQDEWDRDYGGTKFMTHPNVDLRAAYKPILSFAIKWDLAPGDRLEVRAATDFDSELKITSGTWTVLKTYEGACDCVWSSSDEDPWVEEELSLEAFEGYQTWIDFRVVTNTGGGKGVMIDALNVLGNEYSNNVMIESVDLGLQTPGLDNDLSVTIRVVSLAAQEGLNVSAQIFDENGEKVWPTVSDNVSFVLPLTLYKGQNFTVDPTTAGDDWHYGDSLEEGTYYVHVEVWRDDESQVPDEAPANNIWRELFALIYFDDDNDGVPNHLDECPSTSDGKNVDEYGCSESQKDTDSDGISDDIDECPDTNLPSSGGVVDYFGCSNLQKDEDGDGVFNFYDACSGTQPAEVHENETVYHIDGTGCSESQKDDDNDEVMNDQDECPDTPAGNNVTESGCSDEDSVVAEEEEAKEEEAKEEVGVPIEPGGIPSISMLSVIGLLVFITIVRRRA